MGKQVHSRNTADGADRKTDGEKENMKLTEINIYPVKSTRRIALEQSDVLARGLPLDRRWMLVDHNGTFITARTHPQLATVQSRVEDDVLKISAGGRQELELAIAPAGREPLKVRVWKDEVKAIPAGDQADEWFSGFLGTSCRLVQQSDALHRQVDQEFGLPEDEVSFADGFPLLLVTEASLQDLNSRLEQPVSMRRFRPNLVVDGDEPYAEDKWHRIRVGEVEFAGVKNCSRCVFTTIDPETGTKDPSREPLQTLSRYRRKPQGGVFFGQNLIPRSGGTIHVGDFIEII